MDELNTFCSNFHKLESSAIISYIHNLHLFPHRAVHYTFIAVISNELYFLQNRIELAVLLSAGNYDNKNKREAQAARARI